MKKASLFTFYLAIWVVCLFGTAMFMTFLADWIQQTGFFGDVKFIPYINKWGYKVTECGYIDTDWVWGARHYWYFWMCVILFLLSVIRVVIWASYYWEPQPQQK